MNEIIVARADSSMVAIPMVGIGAVAILALAYASGLVQMLVVVLTYLAMRTVGRRMSEMRLSVTPSSVLVVNFASRAEVPLDEVQLVDESTTDPMVTDPEGDIDRTGRHLYLEDAAGQRVLVGVAPSHGSKLDRIAEDLYRTIAWVKAGQ